MIIFVMLKSDAKFLPGAIMLDHYRLGDDVKIDTTSFKIKLIPSYRLHKCYFCP